MNYDGEHSLFWNIIAMERHPDDWKQIYDEDAFRVYPHQIANIEEDDSIHNGEGLQVQQRSSDKESVRWDADSE